MHIMWLHKKNVNLVWRFCFLETSPLRRVLQTEFLFKFLINNPYFDLF